MVLSVCAVPLPEELQGSEKQSAHGIIVGERFMAVKRCNSADAFHDQSLLPQKPQRMENQGLCETANVEEARLK